LGFVRQIEIADTTQGLLQKSDIQLENVKQVIVTERGSDFPVFGNSGDTRLLKCDFEND